MEVALLRDQLDRALDDALDVVLDERQRVHGGDEHSAVPAVAMVHDVPDPVADLGRRIDHARRHESGEVGFDLEIDVVGGGIVEPVA